MIHTRSQSYSDELSLSAPSSLLVAAAVLRLVRRIIVVIRARRRRTNAISVRQASRRLGLGSHQVRRTGRTPQARRTRACLAASGIRRGISGVRVRRIIVGAGIRCRRVAAAFVQNNPFLLHRSDLVGGPPGKPGSLNFRLIYLFRRHQIVSSCARNELEL